MSPRHHRYVDQRKSYAIHRMTIAIERLLMAATSEGKRQASKWAAAWGVASGSAVPPRFKLRKR